MSSLKYYICFRRKIYRLKTLNLCSRMNDVMEILNVTKNFKQFYNFIVYKTNKIDF